MAVHKSGYVDWLVPSYHPSSSWVYNPKPHTNLFKTPKFVTSSGRRISRALLALNFNLNGHHHHVHDDQLPPLPPTSPAVIATNNAAMSNKKRSRDRKRGIVNVEDLPGTRVGPDDGPWPKSYEILEDEEDVWKELRSLAKPHRAVFVHQTGLDDEGPPAPETNDNGQTNGHSYKIDSEAPLARINVVDSINFQPCRTLKTQDRYVVTQLDVHGELWTLTGVFDGHMGDVTVEHVAHHLPIIIRDFLKKDLPVLSARSSYDPQHVSQLFQSAISAFDDAIAHDVLDLFGGSVDKLNEYSDADIRRIINDSPHPNQGGYGAPPRTGKFGANWQKARLCMYGTTALVALVDPKGEGLWVANLGDCMGILVTNTVTIDNDSDTSDSDRSSPERPPSDDEGEWNIDVLTTMHNGDNDHEIDRIKKEHPGEDETCIVDRRVLGALQPTRCLGDIPFKQPPDFSRRILYNLYPFVHNTAPWEEFLSRNKTPPYISADAEVVYKPLNVPDETFDKAAIPRTSTSGKRRSRLTAVLGLEKLASGIKKRRDKKKNGTVTSRKVVRHRYLILASDGFTDLCLTGGGVEKVVKSWAKEMHQLDSPRKEIQEIQTKLQERDVLIKSGTATPMPNGKSTNPPPLIALAIDTSIIASMDVTSVDKRPMSPVSPTSPVPFTAGSFSSSMTSLIIPNPVDAPAAEVQPPPPPPPQVVVPTPAPEPHFSPRLQRPPLPHTNKSYHCTSSSNMALRLLRRVLGGEEKSNDRVAKALTVDMDVSWLDDTAIVVVGL